jgi:ABC-2 type transport system permease protein
MGRMMGRKAEEIALIVLFSACLLFVLADSARFFVRLDLTRNRAFTISPVSQTILRDVPEQVRVTYYLSDTLASLSPAPGRVIDLLQEYAASSGGKLSVSVVEPQREGRAESARGYGVFPQQVQVVQQNEQRTVDVFSSIVVEYLNRYTTLPAVFTPDGLEFNLGLAIRKLVTGRRLVIGVVVGRTDKSFSRDYENLRTGLSRDYWLREYAPGERVPPEVDVLLMLGGTELGVEDLRPVDRYLMDGGKVLFAAKGLRVETVLSFSAASVGASALLDMLVSYGVRVGREMVLDTAARDYRLPQQVSGQLSWETIAKYPPWVSIRTPGVSPRNPITASFSGLDLLWPAALEPVAVEGVRTEALARTTPSAWLMPEPFAIDPYRVPQSGPGQGGSSGQRTLALALSGTFPSGLGTLGGPPQRSAPTRMVVVGDDDFASDLLQFSDSRYNVIFIENAVLWLSGNADLLALKTKAAADGRLDRIGDAAVRGRFMLAAQILNLCVVPAAVLLFGVIRVLKRRDR